MTFFPQTGSFWDTPFLPSHSPLEALPLGTLVSTHFPQKVEFCWECWSKPGLHFFLTRGAPGWGKGQKKSLSLLEGGACSVWGRGPPGPQGLVLAA